MGKTHDQPLAGGSPTDQSAVDLQPVLPGSGRTQRTTGSFLRRGSVKHAPSVSFRFSTPKERLARLADQLPSNIVVDSTSIPLLATFRACLLDSLDAAEHFREPGAALVLPPLYDPAILVFLELCTSPVAFGVFRNRWKTECSKSSRRHRSKRRQGMTVLRHMLTHGALLLVYVFF